MPGVEVSVITMHGGGAWETFVNTHFYNLEVTSAAREFAVCARFATLTQGVRFSEVRSSAWAFESTAHQISNAPDDGLMLILQLAGEARLRGGDTYVDLRPGHAVFCDPLTPHAGHSHGPQHQIVAMVPREALTSYGDDASFVWQPVGMDSMAMRVLCTMITDVLRSGPVAAAPGDGAGLAGATVELMRSVAMNAVLGRGSVCQAARAVARRDVENYVLSRLGDPALTPARIASHTGASRRHLANLFQHDAGLAAFMRAERLRRARADLENPDLAALSTAAIAAKWGFTRPSTFSRAFRQQYGLSPRQVRRAG
ncbi:MAG: helix-turn-helix domain-containing protein [Nocardioides sp.]|uniref:helix-turn-helix domain-containing protein n=1 Tax=Nocardioides sp. TaxID=35761 RepID=UPI0039E258F0